MRSLLHDLPPPARERLAMVLKMRTLLGAGSRFQHGRGVEALAIVPDQPCLRRHRYRGRNHPDGCERDDWPHMHITCRRCGFEWWQPQLWSAA